MVFVVFRWIITLLFLNIFSSFS